MARSRGKRWVGTGIGGILCLLQVAGSSHAQDHVKTAKAFPGFGLSYHLGYGYGGNGVGAGSAGGYPFYGGPGYPRCEPALQRFGKIARVPYYGGPGYPRVGTSNFYDATGPLVARPPVLQVIDGQDPASQTSGYGGFTGTMPYPETLFAPYATAAGTTPPARAPMP